MHTVKVFNTEEWHRSGKRKPVLSKGIRFIPDERVYIVLDRKHWFSKIKIIETRIDELSFTQVIGGNPYDWHPVYRVWRPRRYYDNDSKNIFKQKEDAYEYAESLDRRRAIRFKSVW